MSWNYLWRIRALHRSEEAGGSSDLPPVVPAELADRHSKRLEDGSGPMLHRRFSVLIDGSGMSPRGADGLRHGRPQPSSPAWRRGVPQDGRPHRNRANGRRIPGADARTVGRARTRTPPGRDVVQVRHAAGPSRSGSDRVPGQGRRRTARLRDRGLVPGGRPAGGPAVLPALGVQGDPVQHVGALLPAGGGYRRRAAAWRRHHRHPGRTRRGLPGSAGRRPDAGPLRVSRP